MSACSLLGFVFTALVITSVMAQELPPKIEIENVPKESWYWEDSKTLVLNEYNALNPPTLKFSDSETVSNCQIDGRPCSSQNEIQLAIDPAVLRPKTLELVFNEIGRVKKIHVKMLNGMPEDIEIKGKSAIEKNILLSPDNFILVLSPNGKIIFYRYYAEVVTDFKQIKLGEHFVYSLIHAKNFFQNITIEGNVELLDQNFKRIKMIDLVVDAHDFVVQTMNRFLFFKYIYPNGADKSRNINQVIQEYSAGKISTVFSTREYFKREKDRNFKAVENCGGISCADAGHLNSVQPINKNQILVSLGTEGVVLWNRKRRQPEWIFGGPNDQFNLNGDQSKPFIHTPTFDVARSTLTVFDNTGKDGQSNVNQYVLNTKEHKVVSAKTWPLGNGKSEYGGSVYVDGDVLSIGMGHRSGGSWDFLELQNGKVNMSVRITNKRSTYNYRVYRGL